MFKMIFQRSTIAVFAILVGGLPALANPVSCPDGGSPFDTTWVPKFEDEQSLIHCFNKRGSLTITDLKLELSPTEIQGVEVTVYLGSRKVKMTGDRRLAAQGFFYHVLSPDLERLEFYDGSAADTAKWTAPDNTEISFVCDN